MKNKKRENCTWTCLMSAAFGRKILDLFDLNPHCLNTLTKDLRKELAHSFYPLKILQAIRKIK